MSLDDTIYSTTKNTFNFFAKAVGLYTGESRLAKRGLSDSDNKLEIAAGALTGSTVGFLSTMFNTPTNFALFAAAGLIGASITAHAVAAYKVGQHKHEEETANTFTHKLQNT